MAGCVQVYCGDGKGKTTASIGLCVRAAGRGKQVVIARFLKTDDSGEVGILKQIPGIRVLPCEKTFGFYFQMTEEDKREAADYYGDLLEKAFSLAYNMKDGLLVLDEIMAACNYKLVSEERLLTLLKGRPEDLEVVLTGRNPSEAVMEAADYISEIHKIKHPFDAGVAAREGIEY
ncbi:cob(I)yrinic acid a,c-diamide adenosyltransferase [Clostridium sp. MCC353]|uniref:cob(I)yrinic acid a,c-diamide adenosyltransferase n=1 Tax=Clostridium sp. MCC353 TaxID=2592646 RepID=UPI001C01B5A6|nr:cob(I)yrinic acid a,c-diamide adenosyltransferase [Clostridium sp. MCC353]MBT9775946.1 cob(I)yrinic acid a,c-diamide adenosyltransferase [Clostridium sp. MCC353]